MRWSATIHDKGAVLVHQRKTVAIQHGYALQNARYDKVGAQSFNGVLPSRNGELRFGPSGFHRVQLGFNSSVHERAYHKLYVLDLSC